ncbi:glycosyltransferase family 4 protein [Bacillus sp. JJ1521]|uniref:glycosyltransferase family 4 protein n=1 Tax=Bacillus sp. JJ1521 TaxID=3122957 RepID=UPI002FFD98B0
MKILLATYWLIPHVGGVWAYLKCLKQELENLGHSVDILAHDSTVTKYIIWNTEKYILKRKIREPISSKLDYFNKNWKFTLDANETEILNNELEHHCFAAASAFSCLSQYDLIHTHDVISTRAIANVIPPHIPFISTIHGCLATEYIISQQNKNTRLDILQLKETLLWKYYSAREFFGATKSDVTHVPTHWLKNLLTDEFKVPEKQLYVRPLGMDVEIFLEKMLEPVRSLPPKKEITIICPARLTPEKGHTFLLDALVRLKQENPNWICWLAGDGELKEILDSKVKELNLEEFVVFLGTRDDVPALLKHTDILVLPSLQDNHPYTIMEAQVAGVPVVASDAGGIPEMVTDHHTGLISTKGDSESLFLGLKELIENKLLRENLAKNAREFGINHWSMKNQIHQAIDLYEMTILQKS